MKAIQTKYLGPTNFRGSRIKAWTEGGSSVTISYDSALSSDTAHRAAASALAQKLGWDGWRDCEFVTGGLPSGDCCHVSTFYR